jgi:hypothetical protein
MPPAIRVFLCAIVLFGTATTEAQAAKIVVPPLVARGTPTQTAANMTALIASELEFLEGFEDVDQLSTRPSQLGPNCLGSTPCLAGIATLRGASRLLAGKVTKYGEEFEVVLTFMSDKRIVRTVKRRMPTDPMAVADGVAALVRHAVTGVDPETKAAEDRVSGFEGGGLALMDDEEDEDNDDLLMAAPAVIAVPGSDPLGRSRDDLDEDPGEDRDGGYIVGGVVGAAAVGAAAASAATAAPEAFNPDAINFGGSADDISFGSAATMIQVDAPPEDPMDADSVIEDAYEAPIPAPVRTQRQPQTRAKPARRNSATDSGSISVIARTGYARFQSLNFLTYGIEAEYDISPDLAIIGGFEAYSTKRSLPPDEVVEGQPASFWNSLLPLKLGAKVRLGDGTTRPYVGGDLQLIPGYVKTGGGMAFGFRATGGLDHMFSSNFGLTTGIATGLWAGSSWYLIDGLMNTGFTIQVSAGALLLF